MSFDILQCAVVFIRPSRHYRSFSHFDQRYIFLILEPVIDRGHAKEYWMSNCTEEKS